MAMRIKCPSCATVLQLGDTVAPGSSVRCPKCSTVLRAPAAAPSPAAKSSPPEVVPVKKPAASAPARPSKAVQPAPSRPATTKPRSGDAVSAIKQGLSDMPAPIKPKSKKGILFVILGCAGLAFLLCGGMATFAIYRLYSAGKDFANKAQEQVQNAEQEWQKQVEKSQADAAKTIEEEKKKNTLPVGPNRPENKQPGGDQNLPVNPRLPNDPLPDNPPGGQRLDLSYIATDFNAAFVIHPARLLQAKSSLLPQGEMRDQMLDSIIKESGIDPRQVESVVLVMEPFPGGVPAPGPRPGPAPPGGEVADDWKPFADQAGRFSVLFPGAPVQSTNPQPGVGILHNFLVEQPGGKVAYMVSYNDIPAASATAAGLQKILNDYPKQFGRELKNNKRIELDGNPGVEVELEKKQGRQTLVITGRMYLVKRRMYQVIATATSDKKDPAQIAKFLDSFKLRKPGDPPVRGGNPPPLGNPPPVGGLNPPQPPAAGGGSNVLFMPGFIIRFAAPVDGRDVLSKTLKDMELGPTKNYYRSRTEKMAGIPLAGSIADNRTILLAPETTLKKMLGARNVNSPLIARLRQLDVNHDVAGFFVVGPYKVALAELSKQPALPPQLEALKKLDRDLEAISFTVDVDSDKMIQLVLYGTSAQASQSLEALVRNALDMGKQMYAQIKPAMQNELGKELPPDTANRFVKLVDHIAGNGIAIQRDNKNKVIITLQKPPD